VERRYVAAGAGHIEVLHLAARPVLLSVQRHAVGVAAFR
jgi:hypothetical protein